MSTMVLWEPTCSPPHWHILKAVVITWMNAVLLFVFIFSVREPAPLCIACVIGARNWCLPWLPLLYHAVNPMVTSCLPPFPKILYLLPQPLPPTAFHVMGVLHTSKFLFLHIPFSTVLSLYPSHRRLSSLDCLFHGACKDPVYMASKPAGQLQLLWKLHCQLLHCYPHMCFLQSRIVGIPILSSTVVLLSEMLSCSVGYWIERPHHHDVKVTQIPKCSYRC